MVSEEGGDVSQIDQILLDFLNKKGVKVTGAHCITHLESSHAKLATFIGDRFKDLRDFLKLLRKHAQIGEESSFSLKNSHPETISNVCQLCQNIKALGYLKDCKHLKSPKRYLHVKPVLEASVRAFLDSK